jgi:aspartyl-tRNA(Asn)/glutamyl-tRNA(Gln) amidotransferase subunit A
VLVTTLTSIAAFCASISSAGAGGNPGELSARVADAIAPLIGRAKAENSSQRIYTQILDSRASRAIASLGTRRGAPLAGLPVAIKDNIDVQGTETSCGRRLTVAGAVQSAAIVEHLDSLGVIIIGKTNLDEAALGASGRNPRFGRCANPRCADRLSGGSSSGSAAAVAAGHALLGVGTDTLGSVRIPAAFCAIVGFKPSHGRLSTAGVAPLYPQFDSVGLLAASLTDITPVAALLLGEHAPGELARNAVPHAGHGAACRIAVLDDTALLQVDTEVAAHYRQCITLLQEVAGLEIRSAPRLDWTAMARAALWEVAHQFAQRSAARIPGYHELHDIDGDLGRLLAQASTRPATKLADGRLLIQASAARLKSCLQDAEALLTPTCPQGAPSTAEDPMNHIAAFTAPANAAGLPAVAWHQRVATAGASSLQLIGRDGDDLPLLDLASRLQRHLDRHN